MRIHVYLSAWHLRTSPAFTDAIINPLRDFAEVVLFEYEGNNQKIANFNASIPSIFCMVEPPRDVLTTSKSKVYWAPMLDWVWSYNQEWWDALPRSLNIIAFSEFIARRCILAELKHVRLQYFKDPNSSKPADWRNGNIIFYWNRTSLLGYDVVSHLCHSLNASKLIIMTKTDPLNFSSPYKYPDRIGKTLVSRISSLLKPEEFQKTTQEANVILAPRRIEGIGMTYLEALSRGCAVFAYNAPTMNEYIHHHKNGYLWKIDTPLTAESPRKSWLGKANPIRKILASPTAALAGRVRHRIGQTAREIFRLHPVSARHQNWDEIADLDLRSIGQAAQHSQNEGYMQWKQQLPRLIEFLSDD